MDMRLSSVQANGNGFVVHGTCPHCGAKAAFQSVTGTFDEHPGAWENRMIAAARCIACNGYILAIIKHVPDDTRTSYHWVYDVHYPLGKPDDTVSGSIPEGSRLDFQEALRCRWVNAYNAAVEMCRRALESSCIQLGADPKLVLNDMIEWVHAQGKITTPLEDMAHKVKLGGNRAAHPSDRTLTLEDADAVIEFTREYFQHVYVMPAKMAKFNFDRPKTTTPPAR